MDEFNFSEGARLLSDWISGYLAKPEQYPVLSQVVPGQIRDGLPKEPPPLPEAFDKVLEDFKRILLPGITHWNHPAFFAYFPVTSSPPGILGEYLIAALNVNGMLWKTSPSATELEEVVMAWLRQMIGLPTNFFGMIMDTASVSNLCALASAREALDLGIREKGMAGRNLPRFRIYASEQAHSSIEKAAVVLGFGLEGVRKIGVDDDFRMRPELLKNAIEEDSKNGWRPACVVATVGTTSTTSIDPVPAIADICDQHKLWLHVDAAYAGSAAILPEKRDILSGCDKAGSLVFNPHKWMAVPMDCSAFYTRFPEILKRAFQLIPDYLKTEQGESIRNFMDYGIQLGRRFRALKLWMVIRMYGIEGLQKAIRSHLALASEFADRLDRDPDFERMAPVPFSTVCFRAVPRGVSEQRLDTLNERLLNSVNQTGKVFLSHTKLKEKFALRLSIGNFHTRQAHVKLAFELLRLELEKIQCRS